ncbi:hypothetical protein ACQAYK_03950 [Acidithiobacillus sp. AC3]
MSKAGVSHTTCGCCGRSMAKATAVADGVAYCNTCYVREFHAVPCTGCGKATRTLGGKTPAYCRSCQTQNRRCVRCGKPVPRAGLLVPEGAVCASCARYYQEPRPCPVCGQQSLRLARDFAAGFTEPVCERCRRKSFITCPGCGKHRKPAGEDKQGRIVCKSCLTRPEPFICPRCGQEGRPHSHTRCEGCYWQETLQQRVRQSVALLSREWVKAAFRQFFVDLPERIGAHAAALRLQRYFCYFAKLDAQFASPAAITAEALIGTLGTEGLRRYAVPHGALIRQGLIPAWSDETLERIREDKAQSLILETSKDQWFGPLLLRFQEHLGELNQRYRQRGWVGKQRRFVPRSITSALRAAHRFLEDISRENPLPSIQSVQQMQLDRFLAEHPGYRDGIRAFVRFLNHKEKLFRKLRVESVTRNLPPDIFLDHGRYTALLRAWLTPQEAEIKPALIASLMLLYAQSPDRIVRMRLSDLSYRQDEGYRSIFGRTEILLDRRVSGLVDRYLQQRRALATLEATEETDWLFPGRRHGGHMHAATIGHYLKKQDVTAKQLFATAVYYAYMGGLRHPKVLVRAFGITDQTAVKYLEMLDPRLSAEVRQRVGQS